jgi:hypothetical protein
MGMTGDMTERDSRDDRPQHDEQAAPANPPGPGAGKLEDLERIERQIEAQGDRARRHAPRSGPAAIEKEESEDDSDRA